MLVNSGAEIDSQNINGNSPLYFAFIFKHLEAFRTLLEHHANKEIVRKNLSEEKVDIFDNWCKDVIIPTLVDTTTFALSANIEELNLAGESA